MRCVNFTQCIGLAGAKCIVCARGEDRRLDQALRHGQLANGVGAIGQQLPRVLDPIERALQDFVYGFVGDVVHVWMKGLSGGAESA